MRGAIIVVILLCAVAATDGPLRWSELNKTQQELFQCGVLLGNRAPFGLHGDGLQKWAISEFEAAAREAHTNKVAK